MNAPNNTLPTVSGVGHRSNSRANLLKNFLYLATAVYLTTNQRRDDKRFVIADSNFAHLRLSILHHQNSPMSTKQIDTKLMQLDNRAEKIDRKTLVETFVDLGPLFAMLSSKNNQIVYGRRGTGKTHAMLFLAEDIQKKGDIGCYVDLRNIGSSGGLYADPKINLAERATRLLQDVLAVIHEELNAWCLRDPEANHLELVAPHLDALADEITRIKVVGITEIEASRSSEESSGGSDSASVSISSNPSLSLSMASLSSTKASEQVSRAVRGTEMHYVHFGAIRTILNDLSDCLQGKKVWCLLDEWSVIPIELQPYLADLIRRSIFPVSGYITKIAAIEQRSNFQIARDAGEYVGIELGADASAEINLDDFVVFDNDASQAIEFFKSLIFRHFIAALGEGDQELREAITTPAELVRVAFTQRSVFEEFVRAAEGVPRDAFYILSQAAKASFGSAISINDLRSAAKTWYQRDKEAAVSASKKAHELLHLIVDEVIGHRQARAFLLQSGTRNPTIDELFDKRVLHLLKRNVSSHDEPGVRFDVYKIDYGCYVDLLTTNKAPKGLLALDNNVNEDKDVAYIDVPPDDYRAIRRAILRPTDLNRVPKT